jgi:RNA polymerase sigma factor (sigma-70 family)
MDNTAISINRRTHKSEHLPSYVFHPDFETKNARRTYDPTSLLAAQDNFTERYMPDETTREYSKRMHYAAYRMHKARRPVELERWNARYLALRERIVLGNRKLIYRAVRQRMVASNSTDDMIGECHIVLIQSVAAFNPWLGIRFSTYAYTCLVRALSRLSQRWARDHLAQSLSLSALPDGEPGGPFRPEPGASGSLRIDEFLRADHPLLTDREKAILSRRFCLGDDVQNQTLEMVGRAMGLSKERVRQVQASALDKLRQVVRPVPE